MTELGPGLALVHKPVGETSFSLVRAASAELAARPGKQWKLCHGGTLDPFAHGLLLLLVGGATRLFERLHALPKVYEAGVVFGAETDTGDAGGKVVSRGDPSALRAEAIEAALRAFVGWHEQVPPATSAKKVGGEPAYKKAHRGEEVVLPPSRVYLHEAALLSLDGPRARLLVTVRGGFYVRSLARELGRALSVPAHLESLHRAAIGPFADPGEGGRAMLHGPAIVPWLRTRELHDHELGEVRAERSIAQGSLLAAAWSPPAGFPPPETLVAGLHRGRLAALLREEDGRLVRVDDFPGGL